jgi:predicted secreted protein
MGNVALSNDASDETKNQGETVDSSLEGSVQYISEYISNLTTFFLDIVSIVFVFALSCNRRAIYFASMTSSDENLLRSVISVLQSVLIDFFCSLPFSCFRIFGSTKQSPLIDLAADKAQRTTRIILLLIVISSTITYLVYRLLMIVGIHVNGTISKERKKRQIIQYFRVNAFALLVYISYIGSQHYSLAYGLSCVSIPCLYIVARRTQRAFIVDRIYVLSAIIFVIVFLLSTCMPCLQQHVFTVVEMVYGVVEGSVERGVLLGGGVSNFSIELLGPVIFLYAVGIFCGRVTFLQSQFGRIEH